MNTNTLFVVFTLIIIILLPHLTKDIILLVLLLLFLKTLNSEHTGINNADLNVDLNVDLTKPKYKPNVSTNVFNDIPSTTTEQMDQSILSTNVPTNEPNDALTNTLTPSTEKMNQPTLDAAMYGHDYDMWRTQRNSYTASYPQCGPDVVQTCGERSYDIDSANTLITRKRARDKQCSDGWASKSADYYKYHYADEFDDYANSIWWGRDEI